MSAAELAEAVNGAARDSTGKAGTTAERTVFRWLSGENRWPQTGTQAPGPGDRHQPPRSALGFLPRGTARPPQHRWRRLLCAVVSSAARLPPSSHSTRPPLAPRASAPPTSCGSATPPRNWARPGHSAAVPLLGAGPVHRNEGADRSAAAPADSRFGGHRGYDHRFEGRLHQHRRGRHRGPQSHGSPRERRPERGRGGRGHSTRRRRPSARRGEGASTGREPRCTPIGCRPIPGQACRTWPSTTGCCPRIRRPRTTLSGKAPAHDHDRRPEGDCHAGPDARRPGRPSD